MIPRRERSVPCGHVSPRSRAQHALNAVTVLLFGVAFWRLGFSPELPAVLAFIFGGVLLAVIDWKVQRLPTRLVYLTLAGVDAGCVRVAGPVGLDSPGHGRGGRPAFASAFSLIWFLTKKFSGMLVLGFGDVRLAAVLGWSSAGTGSSTCSTAPSSAISSP